MTWTFHTYIYIFTVLSVLLFHFVFVFFRPETVSMSLGDILKWLQIVTSLSEAVICCSRWFILFWGIFKNINAEFISADAGKSDMNVNYSESDSSAAVLLQEIFKAFWVYLFLCFSLFTTFTSVKWNKIK